MKRTLIVLTFLGIPTVALAAFASFQAATTGGGGGGNTPTFVQGVGSDVNDNNGITGNAYVFNLPNPTLTGNTIVLAIAYPYSASRTFAISDSCGDSWPAATITTGTATTGNMNTKIYVLPNATGNCLHTLTYTFDALLKPFQYTMAEFTNVATSGTADGSSGANSVSCTSAAAGSYTPSTNNDANGGHMIWAYAISNDEVGTTAGTQASAISKTGGISPAFMHANNISTIPSVSSFDAQATNAAINPGFNLTQSSGTNCVVSSVALKAAAAGTAPSSGIRVKRIQHVTLVNPVNGNNFIYLPSDGNLQVVTAAAGSDLLIVNSVTDSNSQTYTNPGAVAQPQVFYHQNGTGSNSLLVNWNANPITGQYSLRLWDIVNADASSFQNVSGVYTAAPLTGNIVNDLPDHTPAFAPSITLAVTGFGTGPTTGLASGAPTNSYYGLVFYTNMSDSDRMDNADGFALSQNSTTTSQTWNWAIASAARGSTAFATAVTFK